MGTLQSVAKLCAGYSILGFIMLLFYGILLINNYRYLHAEEKLESGWTSIYAAFIYLGLFIASMSIIRWKGRSTGSVRLEEVELEQFPEGQLLLVPNESDN